MKTYKLIVKGKVQGVGYRNYSKLLAADYSINGTVRNQSNGAVMIIAQGSAENLENYIKNLKVPQHRLMSIQDIEIEDYASDKVYNNFKVIY